MARHWIILGVASIVAVAFDQRDALHEQNGLTGDANVILVVSDGLRWQEVFRGADSTILFGDPAALGPDAELIRRRFWRATAAERRLALMPFVWGTLVREGQLLGNRDLGSRVDVTNEMRFSYPGYNEMLTGAPDSRITSNEFGPNPNVTVFEWLNQQRAFRGRVAAFGTWDTFRDIFNVERSGIDVRTHGAKPVDIVVHRDVIPYLEEKRPKGVFVGYAETDDWGHEGRYDRFLEAIHAVDAYLRDLWEGAQSHPGYEGRTTLIFTADHGRGRSATDWRHHGREVPGAEETFILSIGPGVAARGEVHRSRNTLGDVASATAASVGLKYDRVEELVRR
jgi:hypothetical protein